MASLDINTFLALKGGDQRSAIDALGMTYGVPSCLINLAKDALNLLPSSLLSQIALMASDGANAADSLLAGIFNRLLLVTGLKEFITESGIFRFLSDDSQYGIDVFNEQLLNNLAGIIGIFEFATSFGSEIYRNYQNTLAEIENIKDCIGKFKDSQEFRRSNSARRRAELAETNPDAYNTVLAIEFGTAKEDIENSLRFIEQANRLRRDCLDILEERRLDPSLEPCFIENEILDITDFCQLSIDESIPGEETSVFRLEFGPPESTVGRFVLASDGLYYDSQTGGLDEALAEIMSYTPPEELRYLFDHAPAAGGKGIQITKEDVEGVVDTLFDPNNIDESLSLQEYYKADAILQNLIGQKNRQVNDLSGQITELIEDEGEDSAVVINIKESLYSTIAMHNSKINRRRKQIELAVRLPQMFDPSGTKVFFAPGEVPINDFSYLRALNIGVSLQKQKELAFKASDVVGIIKPVIPKFVVPANQKEEIKINNLLVPPVDKGGIIYAASAGASSTEPMILSLTDTIVTDELVAVYNFLEAETASPSSTSFLTHNSAGAIVSGIPTQVYGNAKMLAEDPSTVFISGLGIPYCSGILNFGTSGSTAYVPSTLGSILQLSDTKEFRNLTYGFTGWSFESWVYVPDLATSGSGWGEDPSPQQMHRIILACENTGNTDNEVNDKDRVKPKFGTDIVRGMVMGFTRDRRITSDLAPSDNDGDNSLNDLVFYIAPTQSYDPSTIVFLNNVNCASAVGFHKMVVPVDTVPAGGSSSLGDCSSGFVHLHVSFDTPRDQIRVYVDGVLLQTSSISDVFGTVKGQPIRVPSFAQTSSFEYGSFSGLGSNIPEYVPILRGGPKINKGINHKFTPWMIGGGYSDGIGESYDDTENFGFLGNNGGGVRSGLNGHLGSVKFYRKALSNEEPFINFTAQKGFFKNIRI